MATATDILSIVSSYTYAKDLHLKIRRNESRRNVRHGREYSGDVNRLSKSLTQAAPKINEQYASGYQALSHRFSVGDAESSSALKTSLKKLDDGVLSVLRRAIQAKAKYLDYKTLSALSDSIRIEICQILVQLRLRLKQQFSTSPRYGLAEAKSSTTSLPRSRPSPIPEGTHLALVRSSEHKHLHWAVVRPRQPAAKKSSSSSNGSSTANSPTVTANGSPSTTGSANRSNSPQNQRVAAYRDLFMEADGLGVFHDAPSRDWTPRAGRTSPPPPPKSEAGPRSHSAPTQQVSVTKTIPSVRRRAAQPTHSIYSFASDSTKLGEIPWHKWSDQWDFDEQDRVNAAAANPWTPEQTQRRPRRKRPGLFMRIFKRSTLDDIEE